MTTAHRMRNRDTESTVVAAISRPPSPGAMNPSPIVHSANTSAPVAPTSAGCGNACNHSRTSVTNATICSPQMTVPLAVRQQSGSRTEEITSGFPPTSTRELTTAVPTQERR